MEPSIEKQISKRFLKLFSIILASLMLGEALLVIIVDPYFHYHKPFKHIYYKLEDERHQNNGIIKNFTYNAIITGSSMTENFKTSEFDTLFSVNSIKVPFAGGSYLEIKENLEYAFLSDNNISLILEGLDYNRLFNTASQRDYSGLPTYLYDNNPFNDTKYLWNKDITLLVMKRIVGTLKGNAPEKPDFDSYKYWSDYMTYGKQALDDRYARNTLSLPDTQIPFTEEEKQTIKENIEKNLIQIAKDHPDTQFIYYYTPYSINAFDFYRLLGNLEKHLQAEKYITELLLPYDNISIYSFYLNHELIEDFDNYKDLEHHSGEVNSMILKWIKDGYGLLTKDNYEDFYEEEFLYYMNYDYENKFSDWD